MSDLHVLIIDDNRLNQEILEMLLTLETVTSTSVDSVRRIAEVINGLSRVDVIFLDLEFPGGDGFKVLAMLRADERLKQVPIVAYTVHTAAIDAARRAGFSGFLGKPLDAAQFPERFWRIVRGEAVWEI